MSIVMSFRTKPVTVYAVLAKDVIFAMRQQPEILPDWIVGRARPSFDFLIVSDSGQIDEEDQKAMPDDIVIYEQLSKKLTVITGKYLSENYDLLVKDGGDDDLQELKDRLKRTVQQDNEYIDILRERVEHFKELAK